MLKTFLKDIIFHGLSGINRAREPAETSKPVFAVGEAPKVTRLDEIHHLVRGRHGWFLANGSDHYIGAALIEYGEVAEQEVEFLLSLIRPGDVVVEVGSNIGAHSVPLAKAVGPNGLLVTFEPQPPIYRTLCANLALNSIGSVQTFQVGVGNRRDVMTIPYAAGYYHTKQHNSGGMELSQSEVGIPVNVVILDETLVGLPSIRLLKIDVEGMESRVLEGAQATIAKYRPLIFTENDRTECQPALIEQVMALDYRLFWFATHLYNPNNFFGSTANYYPNTCSFDMICVPREMDLPFAITERTEEILDSGQRSRLEG